MSKCKQISELLSGHLDGELTPQDRQRVEVHLESCAACRQAYQDLEQLHQSVGRLNFGQMTPEERSEIMSDLTTRGTRGLGWLLFLIGVLIVCSYGVYEFANDDTVPALIKTGMAALGLGLVFLFFSVLRDRLQARKTDKYKDVEL